MNSNKNNWFYNLFISEAKVALNAHSGSGSSGSEDPNDPTIVLVDENGNELVATLMDEEVIFDATANDIREGKLAVTEQGITVGTKEIPGYISTEGTRLIMPSESFNIKIDSNRCEFAKLLALICTYNTTLNNSVAAEKVVINDSVYIVNSNELVSMVTSDIDNGLIDLGIINEGATPCVIRYITFKEE